MNLHKIIYLIVIGLAAQPAFSDWNSGSSQLMFIGSDLSQVESYSATRGNANLQQTLSYTRNDHQEVTNVFERNQQYEGLKFSSTSSLPSSNILHYSSEVSHDEQNLGGVFSTGQWLFGISAGRGEGYVRSSQTFTGIDPYFSHGGSEAAFRYYGANTGYSYRDDTLFYIGSSTIEADNLEDRHASYAGFNAGDFSATLMNFKRGGETIGKGVTLQANVLDYQVGYRQISRDNGAHAKSLSLELPGSLFNTGKLGFAVESVNNPLQREEDGLGFLLTFSGKWGRSTSTFNAAEDTLEDEKPATGIGTMAIIGAGVVAGAVILSSGSDSKDDGVNFETARQHDAAFTVLNQINPVSVREAREYGGYIYRNPNGTYGHTNPKRGQYKSINLGDVTVPEGTRRTASYHTHGNDDPRYVNEEFSPTDIRSDRLAGTDGYLGTPGGKMKYFDLESDTIVTLSNIAR